MSALTNYLEDALLDHVLRNAPYNSPSAIYVALYNSPTTETGGGTEVSGQGYERIQVEFAAPSGGSVQNSADVVFPTAGPDGWGTVSHAALHDAAAGGNMLWHGPLQSSETVQEGDTIKFNAGAIICSLD